ncbi:hypothetical protein ACWER6_31000 [Streptomyces sp. NPDC004009]
MRFKDDHRLGVMVLGQDHNPTLWVKVVDGWEKDGNWGGYLKVTCATEEGKWTRLQQRLDDARLHQG